MATGDIKNNLGKLQSELRAVNFHEVDYEQLSRGVAQAYLPIYHHVLMNYSKNLAEKISEIGVELYGKTDMRFIEAMYKVLRELFAFKPPLTKDQFFSAGYSEKKVIMCSEIVGMIKTFHKDSHPRKPKSAKSTKTNLSSAVATAGAVGITMSHTSRNASITKPTSAQTKISQKSSKELKLNEVKGAGEPASLKPVGAKSKETFGEVSNLSAIDPMSPAKHFQQTPTADGKENIPITIIASTPCPPVKDVRVQSLEKHEYVGQLNHILKQLQEVQNKIMCIEDRMSAVENCMSSGERAPRSASEEQEANDNPFDPLRLENLLARMTVLEHKVTMLDDDKPDVIKQASSSFPENVPQNVAHDGAAQESELTGTASLTKPFESLENTQQNDSENITVDEAEGKKSDKKTSSPIQTAAFKSLHLHEEFESSPSPIPMKRLASRVFEQGSLYLTKDASSFGELNLGKVEIDSFGLENSQDSSSKSVNQRQRIAAMVNDTEKMLNINGNQEVSIGNA